MPTILDLETTARADLTGWLEPVEAPSNYVKADAIASYIEKAEQRQRERAGLQPETGRIVLIGFDTGHGLGSGVTLSSVPEPEQLGAFFTLAEPPLIGWNIRRFDVPYLCLRALMLGVELPKWLKNLWLGGGYRYSHEIVDLMELWSFSGLRDFVTLEKAAKCLGCEPDDPGTGADVAAWVAAGDWGKVEAHCRADLERVECIATRLGLWTNDSTR